jgi:hypothetical protein
MGDVERLREGGSGVGGYVAVVRTRDDEKQMRRGMRL